MTATGTDTLDALHRSHERLVAVLTSLDDDAVTSPSYDDGWSIAQVASHLGSGAEVFERFIDAGLRDADAPGVEVLKPIWAAWDAKTATAQARDVVAADAHLIARAEA
ncbi:MAG: maleylpyruvate isomerase N-terminal domain-containing protein, partial [Nocardioidaceae bacterium]